MTSQFPKNAKKPINRKQPVMNQPLQQEPSEQQKETVAKIANMFKGRQPAYAPVLKSLEQIGLTPKVMDVMIGDLPVECFVIPTKDLVYHEWAHMTGGVATINSITREDEEPKNAEQ